ncbi:hypothetical protein FHQ18_04000 [Deferribacter autotrophicus]|uniref:Alginate export domain-containing protein n=1 Tax=Deferribacter autotrophicus TaxID=500465 RepID=A0A5A8F5F9_9BACT|nr:hypothetical protein [Deferribacter autotrophicus]KAA0258330.1 hypothetical protein FHQ18_04000 [Deferribacter autotrophicus]
MKKFLVFLALLAFAATSFAVELKLSGNFYVRGSYIKNGSDLDGDKKVDLQTSNAPSFSYFDQDMNLWAKLVVDEDTWVTTRFAIHDEDWKNANENDTDDNIAAERAWLTHKFATGTKLDAGLMSGGGWGTAFGNDVGGKYRVKITQALPYGSLVAWVQKNAEKGKELQYKDAEKDDSDSYAIGLTFKAGDITIKPLVVYTVDSAGTNNAYVDNSTDGKKTTSFDIAAMGKFGVIGFEAEFDYDNVEFDKNYGTDYDVYGIYVNAYTMIDKVKVGGIFAYGSYDKDAQKGYDFDDDFDLTLVLSDWVGFGGGDGLTGMTAYQVYAKAPVMDKLTANASLTYVTSNQEGNSTTTNYLEDATAYEVDLGAAYTIKKGLVYSVAFGYAKIDLDGQSDPDPVIRAYHKISLSF